MPASAFSDGTGLARKGLARSGQLYAGDSNVGAGDRDIYVGECVQNALTLTAISSRLYPHSWLSFSRSKDVAIWFSLAETWQTGRKGVVIETTAKVLESHAIPIQTNDLRIPWEQETSVDLSSYDTFPASAIISAEEVDAVSFRKAAAALQALHPSNRAFSDVFW